jgi:hypothetical protein
MGVEMTQKKDPKDYLKLGRPTVMTPEVVNKLEQAWSMGCSDLEACLFADISKQTLYDYQAKYPDFVDRKERLKEKLVLKARTVIANSLNSDDENTARWYLERKAKSEFGTRTEITGANGGAVSFRQDFDIDKLKELKKIIEEQ